MCQRLVERLGETELFEIRNSYHQEEILRSSKIGFRTIRFLKYLFLSVSHFIILDVSLT